VTASITQWLAFLKSADTLAGIPLLVGGLVLMLFGWRLWRVCVVLSFGLLGAALGAKLAPFGDSPMLCALIGAALLGGLSYRPARYCVPALAGIIGAGLTAYLLSGTSLTGPPFWLVTGVVFVVVSALALINRLVVVICVTAFLGAVLLMSGLTVFAALSPSLYSYFKMAAAGSSIVLPFALLVPSVVSCCYQASETSRLGVEV
jgi:hypothetical protein